MIIVYDLETKKILSTEDGTMIPEIPAGDTSEKIEILKKEGKGYVSVPYELGVSVLDYKLTFNEQGEFTGLQPIGRG